MNNSRELFVKNNPDRHEYLEARNHILNELKKREDRKDELFNLLLDKTISKENYEAKLVILKIKLKA